MSSIYLYASGARKFGAAKATRYIPPILIALKEFSLDLDGLFLVSLAEETDSNADRYRESDRSSNLSDVKADIRAGSSVSNAESVTALDSEGEGSTRGVNALALAGPVPNPLGYRYSADYTEPSFPPKNNVSGNYWRNVQARNVEGKVKI